MKEVCKMNKTLWGKTLDNEDIYTYEIANKNGMRAKLMNYCGSMPELWVPNSDGELIDVVLGHDKVEDYFVNGACFGCVVTPVANRIGGAKFTLNGKEYLLDKNDGNNNLHSGNNPLHRRIWNVVVEEDNRMVFSIDVPDGECGFPGNRHLEISYELTDDNALILDYKGDSDMDTPFNPTHHSYFNLGGHDSGSVMDEITWINADEMTFHNSESVPTGEILSLDNSPMDFRTPKPLGQDVDADYNQLVWGKGYDHNYILKKDISAAEYDIDDVKVFKIASLEHPTNGRKMEVFTSMPGIQLYTGNFIDGNDTGKGGYHYQKRDGVAFETQYFPNALNIPEFDQPLIYAGKTAHSRTVYKFS